MPNYLNTRMSYRQHLNQTVFGGDMMLTTQEHDVFSHIIQRITVNMMSLRFFRSAHLTRFKFEHLPSTTMPSFRVSLVALPRRMIFHFPNLTAFLSAIKFTPSNIFLTTSVAVAMVLDVLTSFIDSVSLYNKRILHGTILLYPQ